MTTITAGSTDHHRYVGLMSGRVEYRVYEDREGWFVDGDYTAIPPKGKSASLVRAAVKRADGAFVEYLHNRIEKWQLKEKAGI